MPRYSRAEDAIAALAGNGILRGAGGFAACWFYAVLEDWLIIRSIILRNLRVRHIGNPLGIFVEVFRPIVICTAHYYYFSLMQRNVPGNQYAIFTIGGFTVWFTFIAAVHGTFDGARWPAGSQNMPGVSRMHLRMAKVIWAFALYLFFAYAVVWPLQTMGQPVEPPALGLSIINYGLAASLGFGYGLVCGAICQVVPALTPVVKVLEWAVFITSGVYDSLLTIPVPIAKIIQYNPLIDLAEYQRHAYYPGYPVFMVTLTYPAVWMVGLVFFGLAANRYLSKRRRR
jgi:capsular polysaccharide transport system permease protein